MIKALGIAGVAGNYDSTVATGHKHCGCRYENPRQYWTQDRSDDFCLTMASRAGMKTGDVIAFGHTHEPWHRETGGMHFVNTGSVGRPKDGDWRAGYVVLDVGGGAVEVEFVRVEYSVDEAVEAIRHSELPDDFAEHLRTGGKPAPTASTA